MAAIWICYRVVLIDTVLVCLSESVVGVLWSVESVRGVRGVESVVVGRSAARTESLLQIPDSMIYFRSILNVWNSTTAIK